MREEMMENPAENRRARWQGMRDERKSNEK
jgi:hypothetical protein